MTWQEKLDAIIEEEHYQEIGRLCHETEASPWISELYGLTKTGDKRLTRRLEFSIRQITAKPAESLPSIFGCPKNLTGFYRLVANEGVAKEAVTDAGARHTALRCKGMRRIYILSDSMAMNMNTYKSTIDLGTISDDPLSRGMWVHTAYVLDEQFVTVGILAQIIWTRDPEEMGKKHARNQRSYEEKESFKWQKTIDQCISALESCLKREEMPELVFVFDAEGDIHELFQEACYRRRKQPYHLVVRSCQDRTVSETDAKLRACAGSGQYLGTARFHLPKREKKPARDADLDVRSRQVTLSPDQNKHKGRKKVKLWAVDLQEPAPPPGAAAVHWLVLTTLPAGTVAEALMIVKIYQNRWKIEEFHKVLKSGFSVEKRHFGSAERIEKFVRMVSPAAARALELRDLARTCPDASASRVFTVLELEVLLTAAGDTGTPAGKMTVGEAVKKTAALGGYLGRKCDGPPGVMTVARGLQELNLLVKFYQNVIKRCGAGDR